MIKNQSEAEQRNKVQMGKQSKDKGEEGRAGTREGTGFEVSKEESRV